MYGYGSIKGSCFIIIHWIISSSVGMRLIVKFHYLYK